MYLVQVYDSLPAKVPLHYNLEGAPDKFGVKSDLIVLIAILSAIGILIFLLLMNLKRIDPKIKEDLSDKSITKIAIAITIGFTVLQIFLIYNTSIVDWKISTHILVLTGVLFAILGNYMYNIKQNYFLGIRTPWNLESEDNWKATHRLAGKLWFFGGILVVVFSLILVEKWALVFFAIVTLIISLTPIIYSYTYYKKINTPHKDF